MTSRGRRNFGRRVLTVLICVVASMIIAGGCANVLILHPTTYPIDPRGAQRRMIPLSDDAKLEVWTARSPGARGREPEAFLLDFTGNGTRAEQIATYVAHRWGERPVEAWVVNYPGYGGSSGPSKLSAVPPAALKAYDALRKIAGERPIFLEGNSFGTTVALYVATQRTTPAIILQNPPPLRRLILQRYAWWNLGLLALPVAYAIPGELNSTDTAPRVTVPALFLLSDKDEVIPPYYHDVVVAAYAGPKATITLQGAGHNDGIPASAEAELQTQFDRLWSMTFPTTRPAGTR